MLTTDQCPRVHFIAWLFVDFYFLHHHLISAVAAAETSASLVEMDLKPFLYQLTWNLII